MPAEILYPYETLGDARPLLTLANARVDDRPVDVLPREGHVDMYLAPPGWRRATLAVRVQAPADQIDEIADGGVRVVVVVHCAVTNLRTVVTLEAAGAERRGQYIGELELESVHLRGRAQIEAIVAATVGHVPDRYLGHSRSVVVDLEEPRSIEISGGDVTLAWRRFDAPADDGVHIDPVFHDEPAWLDITDEDEAVLYLNEGVADLRRLLDDRPGRTALEKAARDAVFDSIAVAATVAMFNGALQTAAHLAGDEGGPPWPTGTWAPGVLRALLGSMYPSLGADEALTAALADRNDPDGGAQLQALAHAAASRLLKTTRTARSVVRAMEDLDQ
jgi:hypothetical protein